MTTTTTTTTRRLTVPITHPIESMPLSSTFGRFYLAMGYATSVAWASLVFAHKWDEQSREGNKTAACLCSASASLATKSFVIVGLGATWPLAPVILDVCAQRLRAVESYASIKRENDDRHLRFRSAMERYERQKSAMERYERQREERYEQQNKERHEKQRQEKKERDQEAQNKMVLDTLAKDTKRIPEAGHARPCPWCLEAH
jgi:hypothetical protein